MEREQAIAQIRENWRSLYPADRKNKGIICPLCGSGSGDKGTGITGDKNHNKPNSLKCWACGFTGDVIDLIQQEQGIDFNEAIKYAAKELNITIDAPNSLKQAQIDFSDNLADKEETAPNKATETRTEGIADYTAYYEQCKKNINAPAAVSYLTARGISIDTAISCNLGFDATWISPTVRKNQQAKGSNWLPNPTARIIMPVSSNHYVARAIDPNITEYAKMNETGGGKAGIFNFNAVYSIDKAIDTAIDTVFITEGIFDALSIIEAGAQAVALNSTNNAELFIKQLEQEPTAATLILCLDNDEAGRRAAGVIKAGLTRLNISYVTADICGTFKDPNEALIGNKDAFITAIEQAKAQTAARPDNTSSYIDNLMQADIVNFKSDKKTGFNRLDTLSGGIYPGLYVLAATSSLGKTTFALQLADNLAAAGNDVLFFSMEQSRLEMVSKSLARITKELHQGQLPTGDKAKSAVQYDPLTSLEIRQGKFDNVVTLAAAEYKNRVADRLSIIEGNFNCNISFIGEYVNRYAKRNGSRPIIFIDYLQILQAADDDKRATTKDIVDNAVRDLKRLSREQNLTIFVISSVNRANYLTPIDFESLKESGGIEFTADVIWGLQLQCLNEPLFNEANKIKEKRQRIRQEKAANPRKIELLCLKNRYGVANFSCGFNYYPKNDYFEQAGIDDFNDFFGENPYTDTIPAKNKNRI